MAGVSSVTGAIDARDLDGVLDDDDDDVANCST